jgi:hypothetical protein
MKIAAQLCAGAEHPIFEHIDACPIERRIAVLGGELTVLSILVP